MLRFRYRIMWRRKRRAASKESKEKYALYKEDARILVHTKIAQLNTHYGHPIKKIFIKNHRSRWGSCSSKGNLNFNYKIVFLSEELQNYLIVHELCHLEAFNHSPKFWSLVAQTIPHYKMLQKKLKEVH